jgi:membrane associated rhomboid family serine protease
MWYLWIFGDNIEDRFGALRFLIFYLGGGICASLIHLVTNPDSHLPTVGASGAIAGVLGAYAVMFPGARVITLVPLFPFFQVIPIPAAFALGLWFVFQIFAGTISLGRAGAGGGVAWWAHIGGFLFGVLVAQFAARLRGRRASRAEELE